MSALNFIVTLNVKTRLYNTHHGWRMIGHKEGLASVHRTSSCHSLQILRNHNDNELPSFS